MTEPSATGDQQKPEKKTFLKKICSQCYNTKPPKRWQRAKIFKVWENPFLFRACELIISTGTAGIFMECSIPLEGHESLALHTGLCGPVIPIFALFSSSVMLDRNPKSPIATFILLGVSAFLYFVAGTVIAMNMPRFKVNRSKFQLSLVAVDCLAYVNMLILLADICVPWMAAIIKFVCCSPCLRKKKDASKNQPDVDQPAAP